MNIATSVGQFAFNIRMYACIVTIPMINKLLVSRINLLPSHFSRG